MTPCESCSQRTRIVCGDGPAPCRYMAIGEAPGREEDRGGRCFIGPSGMEFNEGYLHLAGLHRDDVYVTNTVKCRPDNNRKPRYSEAMACANHHLPQEIQEVQPEIVFLLGATACSLVPGIDLEADHGIPRRGRLYDHDCWLVPMFHPASGMHNTAMMIPQLEDWAIIDPWLEYGIWAWPRDEYPNPDYVLARNRDTIDRYFEKYWIAGPLSVDTESQADSHNGRLRHYSTQASIQPGTAVMTYAGTDEDAYLRSAIRDWHELTFHNEPADLPIVGPVKKYRDTMIEAYNLGNLPQGLKALGLRLCGVRMQSYLDVVMPHSRAKVMQWMSQALGIEVDRPTVKREQLKTKVRVTTKANETEKLLWRTMRHTEENI